MKLVLIRRKRRRRRRRRRWEKSGVVVSPLGLE
jgi:hypothetical protein